MKLRIVPAALAAVLALALVFSLSGCAFGAGQSDSSAQQQTEFGSHPWREGEDEAASAAAAPADARPAATPEPTPEPTPVPTAAPTPVPTATPVPTNTPTPTPSEPSTDSGGDGEDDKPEGGGNPTEPDALNP